MKLSGHIYICIFFLSCLFSFSGSCYDFSMEDAEERLELAPARCRRVEDTFVGYKTREVELKGRTYLDVVLEEASLMPQTR